MEKMESKESNESTDHKFFYDFEFVSGKRVNSCLLYTVQEKQLYVKNRKLADGSISWLCRKPGCGDRIYQNGNYVYRSFDSNNHMHGDQEQDRLNFAVYNKIKLECKNVQSLASSDSQTSAVHDIFSNVLKQNQNSTLDFNKISRNLMKIGNKSLPQSPKTCEEIVNVYLNENVMKEYGMTKHDDNDNLPSTMFYKYTYESNYFSYSIFASDNIVNNIKEKIPIEERNYLMDATFKFVPVGPYKQLLLIYVEYRGNIFPFVFILMSRKTESAYHHAFKYINENIISLECSTMMIGFELAMRSAFRKLYPHTEMNCCWFHFCQATKKKAAQCEKLLPYIKTNQEAEQIYYKLMALPLLPPNLIVEQFYSLKARAMTFHRNAFNSFIQYFEKQWILKEGPENISVYNRSTRTTGFLESYNGKIGKKIVSKGTFFKFVKVLIGEEFSKSREFIMLMKGCIPEKKKSTKWQVRNNKIASATEKLNNKNNSISASVFLDTITNKNNKIVDFFER